MSSKIQHRRGLKADIKPLSTAEIGFCTDTKEAFIGSDSGNILLSPPSFETSLSRIKPNGTASVGSSSTVPRADHVHPTDDTRAAIESPTFTGTPKAPTAATSSNSTQIATTAFVKSVVGDVSGKRTATLTIGRSGSGADYECSGTGTSTATATDHTKINNAIQNLPSTGGKIVILEGTYYIGGQITISKANVTIEGMGDGTVLVRRFNTVSLENRGIINVKAANVTISGIYFDGNKSTHFNESASCISSDVEGGCNNLKLLNNTFANSAGYGINICYSHYTRVAFNNIKDNNCGIYAGSSCSIQTNTISDNLKGIYIDGSANCAINGNTIHNNDEGIYIETDSKRNTISSNVCYRGNGTSSSYGTGHQTIYIEDGASLNVITSNIVGGLAVKNNSGNATNIIENNMV